MHQIIRLQSHAQTNSSVAGYTVRRHCPECACCGTTLVLVAVNHYVLFQFLLVDIYLMI